MDRKKKDDLPKMQVGFIDFICMPVYKVSRKWSDEYRAFSHDVASAISKQRNGGHIGVPNQSSESWTFIMCNIFLLCQQIWMAADHLSENVLHEFYTLASAGMKTQL